jgi:hypothetical protein
MGRMATIQLYDEAIVEQTETQNSAQLVASN